MHELMRVVGSVQADGATPALSADAEGTLGRLEGMLMSASQQHAKFEKKVLERTENIESMSMQSAMTSAKQHSQSKETLERLEGLAMGSATSVAKLDSKVKEKTESIEGMLMAASMESGKFRTTLGACLTRNDTPAMRGSRAGRGLEACVGVQMHVRSRWRR